MGIRDDKWKYIHRIKDRIEELYNLEDDPEEKINVATKEKELIGHYRKLIYRARIYNKDFYKKLLNKK